MCLSFDSLALLSFPSFCDIFGHACVCLLENFLLDMHKQGHQCNEKEANDNKPLGLLSSKLNIEEDWLNTSTSSPGAFI